MKKIYNHKFILIIFFILFSFPVVSSSTDTFQDQLSDISSELMCPVCRGQTVSESNSDLANDFREIIKTKLKEGQTKEEILSYFTSRYGDSVLASPPARGFSLLIWILPIIVLAAGFVFLTKFLSSNKKKELNKNTEKKDIYLNKVDEELNKLD